MSLSTQLLEGLSLPWELCSDLTSVEPGFGQDDPKLELRMQMTSLSLKWGDLLGVLAGF